MQIQAILLRWVEVLAMLVAEVRALWQARKSIIVTSEDARFLVRRSGAMDNILANVAIGTRVPSDILRSLRNPFIVFELPTHKVVTRHVTVPAQAREFMAGIIANQIERLSPWPLAQAVYGFDARPSQTDAGILDVCVLIASRANIETIRDELTASGLAPSKIRVRTHAAVDAPVVNLWTHMAQASRGRFNDLPRMVGAGLVGMVLLSMIVSLWAAYSANATWAENDEVTARADSLRRHDQILRKPPNLASLKPDERAWALKEESSADVLVLDALTRAIPDGAYLTELHLQDKSIRINGLAADAPSLIAALERTRHFSAVHFFAPTVKSQDGGLYRFSIAARVAPRHELLGD
ncbi:MAG: PilN domain-containing protein [Methylovirgula sp.]